ncbi:GOLPH3/VPS74 family protein [Actinosynnema sp. NPDC004786]
MTLPDSLPQRVFLLAHHPEKGKVGGNAGPMLRAAALADLHHRGRLADVRGRPAVAVRHPCHDPVLDAVLEEVARAKPHTWQSWIGRGQRATFRGVRHQLGDRGWVDLRPHRVLGLFPATDVTIRDLRVRDDLLARVHAALRQPLDTVDPADAALVTVLAAGDLRPVLDRKTQRADKQRIRDLAALSGPIGPALRNWLDAAAVGAA